jgi:hypothetical protein
VSNGKFIAPIVAVFIVAGVVALLIGALGPQAGWSAGLIGLAQAVVIVSPFVLLLLNAPKGK